MPEKTKDPREAAEAAGLLNPQMRAPSIPFIREEKRESDHASFWDLFNFIQKAATHEGYHIMRQIGYAFKIEEGRPKTKVSLCALIEFEGKDHFEELCRFEFELDDGVMTMTSIEGGFPNFERSFPIPIDASLAEEDFSVEDGQRVKALLMQLFSDEEV